MIFEIIGKSRSLKLWIGRILCGPGPACVVIYKFRFHRSNEAATNFCLKIISPVGEILTWAGKDDFKKRLQ